MDIETKRRLAHKHKLGLSDEQLSHVEFIYCDDERNSLQVDGTIVVFNKPIYLAPGIRLCPLYPQFGVTADAVLYNRATMLEWTYSKGRHPDDYIKSSNPDKCVGYQKEIPIHRIMASAWCDNPNPIECSFVNHKDGIKHNNNDWNLEWVTPGDNVRHAFENNLIETGLSCMVKDLVMGGITIYGSFAKAASAMGTDQARLSYAFSSNNRKAKIVFDRYEVKLLTDKTPWLCDTINDIPSRDGRAFRVRDQVGKIALYKNLRAFNKAFDITVRGKSSSRDSLNIARLRNPDMDFSIIQL